MGEFLHGLDPRDIGNRAKYQALLRQHVSFTPSVEEAKEIITGGIRHFWRCANGILNSRLAHLYTHVSTDGFYELTQEEGFVLTGYFGARRGCKASVIGAEIGRHYTVVGKIRHRALAKLRAAGFNESNILFDIEEPR